MTIEKIRKKLLHLHTKEDELNREIGNLDKAIRKAQKTKLKIAKQVSNNMIYRNSLIEKQK